MEKLAGIEIFFEFAKPEEVTEEVMTTIESQKRKGHFISPISTLALQYLESGQLFLQGITGLVFDRLGDVPKPEELPQLLDPNLMSYAKTNEYAIEFASVLHTIQQTLWEGVCELGVYADFYNQAVRGTYLKELHLTGSETLQSDNWQGMISVAKEDLSLSNFFTRQKGRNALPSNLKNLMFENNGFVPTVNRVFIAPHRRLYDALNLTNQS